MSTTSRSTSRPGAKSSSDIKAAGSGSAEADNSDTSDKVTIEPSPKSIKASSASTADSKAGLLPLGGLASAYRKSNLSTAALFVAATSLIVGILAFIWASSQGDRFSATAVVQLEPSAEITDNRELVDIIGSIDRGPIVVTLAGVATSGSVTSAAQEQIDATAQQMESYEVEALQVLTSHLVDITVTGPSRSRSEAYADAIADQLRLSFAQSHPVYQITTVTPAAVPDSSGRPGTVLIVLAAMLAAAIGAVMLWLALFGGSDERTDLPLRRFTS